MYTKLQTMHSRMTENHILLLSRGSKVGMYEASRFTSTGKGGFQLFSDEALSYFSLDNEEKGRSCER